MAESTLTQEDNEFAPVEVREPNRLPPRPKRSLLHKLALIFGTIGVIILLLLLTSIIGAARMHGKEDFKSKWADWLRANHAGFLVQRLENAYFASKQPKKGGTVHQLHAVPTVAPETTLGGENHVSTTLPPHLSLPGPVPLVVHPGAPNEGVWQPTGPLIDGLPTMAVAQFRADDIFTSQLASAVWIDTKLLRVNLYAGAEEPPGQPPPHSIQGDALKTVVAAFNGGFRFQDAHGGMYLNGQQAVPLRDGAASVVINKDGSVDVGSWNTEVHMTPNVEAVLQNLTLMVDNGRLDPRITHNDTSMWGSTLKGSIAVARSGIGVTKDGALIYVAGPFLTAKSLAESLQRAGAVRAMSLDINPYWVTFLFYHRPDPSQPSQVVGSNLYPEMTRPTNRYLSNDSRDFFTVSTR